MPSSAEYDVALRVESQIQRVGKELLHRKTKTPAKEIYTALPAGKARAALMQLDGSLT